ncbi:hypothetical protein DDB_G0270306 [Dictyostelium discoideum AX4]|uniref:Uncharacterized protein DDB_G0270306 n=1 Tax=Dictyostelium discoideum TaxID=44689 RepID=Y0306_DICDI|nr:hypothetical protein DDB_G0270306 [Dictyostelium discoideum AX4]Q55BY9.1 RecName: Full=Uncharacterized protein DDB_G0270306 [Dictyostelium discoideum]EAL72503.1 hypothetical protein DDB_G0270306 [Dictyostelium discoideum AX4]|eukprot:XP_646692.1 hypothetical protein DDB_G0270306 [Dictyostelium discoideum AX4]
MIVNQALIELTKQVAVAVEEIKFSPNSTSNNSTPTNNKLKSSSSSISNCDSPSSKSKSNSSTSTPTSQPQTPSQLPQQAQQQAQQQHYSANSMNPYYAQQVLLQLQKPSTFVKHVHVVVKNTPFGITLRSKEPLQFNFQNYVIKATLLYDSDPPKMVDFIHNEPLQYVATVSEDGSEVCVDVKVGILSSQHQGSMFLVVLHISHCSAPTPSNSEPISTILTNIGNNSIHSLNVTNICVVSHPIRIVSKLDHVKKEGIPILKKRTFHEILTDKLKKLQKSQDSQSKWIKNLYQQHGAQYDMEPYNSTLHSQKTDSLCSSSTSTPSFNSTSSSSKNQSQSIKNEEEEDGGEDEEEEGGEDNDNESESSNTNSTQLIGKKSINKLPISTTTSSSNFNNLMVNNNINNNNNNNNNNHLIQNTTFSSTSHFQNSFNRVVEVYNLIPEYERVEVIRKMVQQLKSYDLEQLVSTFIDELKCGYESTIIS